MAEYMKMENFANGTVLGLTLGAALLWGDKIRDPIVNWLNSIMPDKVSFLGSFWAPLIVLATGALIGYAVDRT